MKFPYRNVQKETKKFMVGYLGLGGKWGMTAMSIRFLCEMMKMFLNCGKVCTTL